MPSTPIILTPSQRTVLDHLAKAGKPTSAKDIAAAVYAGDHLGVAHTMRALNVLVGRGLAGPGPYRAPTSDSPCWRLTSKGRRA